KDTAQKSRQNSIQALGHCEIVTGEMLRNGDRFENRQQNLDLKLDRDISADMPRVAAAREYLYERLFDDLSAPPDEVFRERRFLPAQVSDEDRLGFRRVFLQEGGELAKYTDEIAGVFGDDIFQFFFCIVEFLGQNAFEQVHFAREVGIKGFL